MSRGPHSPLGRTARTCALIALCALLPLLCAQELPPLGDEGGGDELTKATQEGTFGFVIVGPDGKQLNAERYIRGIPGQIAISDFPKCFTLEGKPLFAADVTLAGGPDVGDTQVKLYSQPGKDNPPLHGYVSRCSADLPPGRYKLEPFGLDFQVNGRLIANHPALSVEGQTLKIHTVPVTFAAVEEGSARGMPLTDLRLKCRNSDLLENMVPKEFAEMGARWYLPLTLYLPRGVSCQSSMGEFDIDRAGKISARAVGAQFADGTFTKTVRPARQAEQPVGKGYWLCSQALRRVFTRDETALFHVIASGRYPAAELAVVAKNEKGEWKLGALKMPEVAGVDSRRFLLDVGALAPGKYDITLAHADAHAFAVEVVDFAQTTPLFLHCTACCNGADFTTDSEGLAALEKAGVRSITMLGFHGVVQAPGARAPEGASPYPAPPADAPPELRRALGRDELTLDDMLRHGVGTVDYQSRRAGFSFEGLAYHHSYAPSVERMVRRTQIFGQEFEDYPAFLGLTYTWFPKLGGYHEGTVIGTDPLFGARMEALRKMVKEQTGFAPVPWNEVRDLEKADPDKRREVTERLRNYWRAEQRIGWQDSFALYNSKLREVRPDFLCTTHENAGHDEDKLLCYMGGAHDAMSFESYTDFGDWPMSSGFTVDWSHGNIPGKPVWITIEGLQDDASQCADALYAFARGAEGIGIPMREPEMRRTNERRSRIYEFLERYGSLISDFHADPTVAVMFSELGGRRLYDCHALHSHLMRLGYAPIVLSEKTVEEKGVSEDTRVVFLPNFRYPLTEKCEKALGEFIKGGGKVVIVGEKTLSLDGATKLEIPLKQLWDIGGFQARMEFWEEFKRVRPHLEKLMADLGMKPLCGAEPEKALIIPFSSGGLLYVAVIASPLDCPDVQFEAVRDVAVQMRLPGIDKVINLVTGQTLEVKEGKVRVDLVSEPGAVLAVPPGEMENIELGHPTSVVAGDALETHSQLPLERRTGPVEYTVRDSAGRERGRFYRLAGVEVMSYRTAANDPPGNYTVHATELITGRTVEAKIPIQPLAEIKAAVETEPVHIVQPHRIPLFFGRKEPVRVVIEDTQADLLPEAERVVEALKKSGRAAEVQRVGGGSFDTLWLRWFPGDAEQKLLDQIDTGEVVGWRGNMEPFIDKRKRAHLPERGGWSDIPPNYILRTDVVLFSGGRLADSIKVMARWLDTEDTPGRGQATLGVALSPFWADREALVIVARDAEGRAKAVQRVAEIAEAKGNIQLAGPFARPQRAKHRPRGGGAFGTERVALATPLKGFVPPAKCGAVLAASDGWRAVLMADRVAFIAPDGKTTAVARPEGNVGMTLSDGGRLFCGDKKVLELHPAWHFPTGWAAAMKIIDPAAGTLAQLDPPQVFSANSNDIHSWEHAFRASPDGKRFFAGMMGGGFVLYDLPDKTARTFHDPADTSLYYERVRAPLCPTAVGFSPDGGLLAFATATFPIGHGNMGQAWDVPFAGVLKLVNLKTGKTVWRRDAESLRDYSIVAKGTILVAPGGKRLYLMNFNHDCLALDESGRTMMTVQLREREMGYMDRLPDPVRLELSRDAGTVLFAGERIILITDADGREQARVTVEYLSDARLAPDGSRFYAADADGTVRCFSRAGEKLWELQTDGAGAKLAVREGGLVVGEGAGNVLLVSSAGAVERKIDVASLPLAELKPSELSFTGPALYREPGTLEALKKHGLMQVAAWQPQGAGRKLYGRTFHPVAEPVTLQAKGGGPLLVEFVYRHSSPATRVALAQGDKELTFELDMPTPEYRAVCLPALEKGDLTVTVRPGKDLEVAALAVYAFKFPGVNSAYVKPAGADLGGFGEAEPEGDLGTGLEVLDLDDSSSIAAKVRGKMKSVAVYSNSIDPDRVQGQYFKGSGSPLLAFDGKRFTDGRPQPWTEGKVGMFTSKRGSRVVMDLTYRARPKLCVTFERTLKQSEVMEGISVMGRLKGEFAQKEEGADAEWATYAPCAVAGLYPNDQFFNVFDLTGRQMDIFSVFIYGGEGREHGLSEVELYD